MDKAVKSRNTTCIPHGLAMLPRVFDPPAEQGRATHEPRAISDGPARDLRPPATRVGSSLPDCTPGIGPGAAR